MGNADLVFPIFLGYKYYLEIYMNNGYNNRPPKGGQNNAPRQNGQPYQQGRQPYQNPGQGRMQTNGSQMPRTGQQPYRAAPNPNGQYQYRAQQQTQRPSGNGYPVVQHASRKQSQRAAGFVVLIAAILVMLLISLVIFVSRCASGSIGSGGDTTPSVGDTTPIVGIVDGTDDTGASDTTEPPVTTPPETALDPKYEYSVKSAADVHRGYLLLINGEHEYTFDGGFTLQNFYGNKSDSYKLSGTDHKFDALAMSWCDKMMDAIAAHMGTGDVLVNSSFRTKQDQQDIYDYYLSTKGQAYVDQYVALPGHSEHHTGLAVDFTIYTDNYESYTFDDKTEYPEWLRANSYKYGFIQRYSADKVEITGVAYENWHYRYVGKPHAYYMVKENLCYEEYVEFLRGFEFGEKHLAITDDEGKSWEIYFVPADESGTTNVPVPKYVEYDISGNNVDGFIVTCHM